MEHLNRLCKTSIKGLGANKTEKAIVRVGKKIRVLGDILIKTLQQNVKILQIMQHKIKSHVSN